MSPFRRRLGQLVALSQYGFPFAIGPFPTPVSRFRALARPVRFAQKNTLFRWLTHVAMTLAWPFGAVRTALVMRARMRDAGQPCWVLLDMVWLALRHSIPPLEYARYRFHEPAGRTDMHEYVYWNDTPALPVLNDRRGADNRDVQDKHRFAKICAKHGFPHVPTLAVFEGGKQVDPSSPFVPHQPQLWTKALRLKGGAGGALWVRDGDVYSNREGARVAAAAFAAEMARTDCLIQPFVENHPVIAPVTNGALSALRVVTGMKAAGSAEFVAAFMGLPRGRQETLVGGVICAIERESGRIRDAMLVNGDRIRTHPDTGAPIVDVVLPFWHESIALVRRAHAVAFPRFAFLGWDVALTAEGPVLLETNAGWGALFHQMLDGPLGHTAFSELVAQHV